MKKTIMKFAVLLLAIQAIGCASLGVEPWERDLLAKDEMAKLRIAA